MPTLYIDVYFLINFTVDAAALYFAVRILHLPFSRLRLLLSAAVGGLSACVFLFLPKGGVFSLLGAFWILLSFFLISWITVMGERFSRILRFGTVFLLMETAIGGAVYLFYGFLERKVAHYLPPEENGYRRKLILAAVLLFLGSSLAKLLFSVFGRDAAIRSCVVTLTLFGKSVNFSCLLDSGNLATDPMNRAPVLFVKREAVSALLPPGFSPDPSAALPPPWSTRLRLIPYHTESGGAVAVAFVADGAKIQTTSTDRKGREKIMEKSAAVTFAVDSSPGDYGGFSGLLPTSLID